MFLGTVLIVLGVLLLLKNLGVIQAATWDVLWPVLLIIFGFVLLKRKRGRASWWESRQNGNRVPPPTP